MEQLLLIFKLLVLGVLICDSAGKVEVALSKKRLIPLGPLEIKAKALEEGFHFAWDVGICEVILECDFKIVLALIHNKVTIFLSKKLRIKIKFWDLTLNLVRALFQFLIKTMKWHWCLYLFFKMTPNNCPFWREKYNNDDYYYSNR